VKWIIEVEGAPAFPHNAAQACLIASRMRAPGGIAEALSRLADALGSARVECTCTCQVTAIHDPDCDLMGGGEPT